MLKAAKEYLALLTGGRYVDLELGKKLTVIRKMVKSVMLSTCLVYG